MSYYEEKYRQRTIEYREEGHTLIETSQVFKVSVSTIRKWVKLKEENGNSKKKALNRTFIVNCVSVSVYKIFSIFVISIV